MHICDNPRCINPDHLKAGDWDTNNKDRAAKGRSAKAVPSRRKVSMEEAREIRRRWALRTGTPDRVNGVMKLAKDYGVDTGVIYNIVKMKSHVE